MNPFDPFGCAVPQKYLLPLPYNFGKKSEFNFILAVQNNWLRDVISQKRLPSRFQLHPNYTEDEVFAFLSQSKCQPLGPNWQFVHLTYLKSNSTIKTFRNLETVKTRITTSQHNVESLDLDDFIGELSYRKVWTNPYISVLDLPEVTDFNSDEESKNAKENFIECEEKVYTKSLLDLIFAQDEEEHLKESISPTKKSKNPQNSSTSTNTCTNSKIKISNLAKSLAIINVQEHFLLFRPYTAHTVQDLITYSPVKLSNSTMKQLFLLYQILRFLNDVENCGLFIEDLCLNDFYIDEGLYLSVYPSISSMTSGLLAPKIQRNTVDPRILKVLTLIVKKVRGWGVVDEIILDLESIELIIRYWIEGLISNYDYIMFLNYLVGRGGNGNPNSHPIFPWVLDFQQGSWRDLTKSKFRINKGERQLDLTYEECQNSGSTTPHHVNDLLSEITYYIYKARRTPKEILCKFVRPKWIPEEYPISISRMQEWTPDECIPEFYDDPTIFQSIHSDLPNLTVPNNCQNPDEFIMYHRKALESDSVSAKLHHWIDLTFGYKLNGTAAVKAKNVYLSLVDGHQNLQKHGIVQLFQSPHPPKKSEIRNRKNYVTFKELKDMRTKEKNEIVEDADYIHLPRHYDPIGFLNDLEVCITFFQTHFTFSSSKTKKLPPIKLKGIKQVPNPSINLKQFACFFVELVQNHKVRHLSALSSICDKFSLYQDLIENFNTEIPIYAKRTLEAIFHPEKFEFTIPLDITLNFLLNSGHVSPLPFPKYFSALYDLISSLSNVDLILQNLTSSNNLQELICTRQRYQEIKVKAFSKDLISILSNGELYNDDGLDIILPFVHELFSHPGTRVQAVWNLLYPLSRAIGREKAASFFLQPLIQIYEADYNSDKHLKLFHRSFFLQLMSCFGLESFLENFSTLLIEACANWPKLNEEYESENNKFDEEEIELESSKSSYSSRTHLKSKEILEVNIPTMKPSPKSIISAGEVVGVGQQKYTRTESELSVISNDGQNQNNQNHLIPEPEIFLMEGDLLLSSNSDSESNSSQQSQNLNLNNQQQYDKLTVDSSELIASYDSARKLDITVSRMKSTSSDISEMCSESIIWLAHRLGPVLTAKYLTRNLLRMLTICYSSHLDLQFCENNVSSSSGELLCEGDSCAKSVFECLLVISDLYGDAFIERQYLNYCIDVINSCFTRMSPALEAALIGVAALLEHIFRHMSDTLLVLILNEMLIKNILRPILSIVCSKDFNLPSGVVPRSLLASKTIGMLKAIKKKLGPDMALLSLKPLIDQLGSIFERIYSHTYEEEKEVRSVFGQQLGHQLYSSFYDIISGSSYEEILRDLYIKEGTDGSFSHRGGDSDSPRHHEKTPERMQQLLSQRQSIPVVQHSSSFGSKSFGNRIQIQDIPQEPQEPLQTKRTIDRTRHLKGNWLHYWDNEVGISEPKFNFKQIKLQTFVGHTGAIRSIYCLNNENSFLTASKDKTVKVYSLRNQGDENVITNANWTYKNHKRPVLSIVFNEELHLAHSTDGSIHIWDPFVGKLVKIIEKSTKPICTLKLLENSCSFVGACVDSSVHVVDPRTCKSYEMRIGISQNSGLVRCMTVSNSGQVVSVGHSSGMISGLDLRNGSLLGSWKAHEGEVLKLNSYKDKYIISSAFDQAISVWNLVENKLAFNMRGATEPVHCLLLFNNNLITCTTSNRIGVYSKIDPNSDFSSTRLRSDSFKGIVTSLNLLPLNQLILLGSDSGNINLLC